MVHGFKSLNKSFFGHFLFKPGSSLGSVHPALENRGRVGPEVCSSPGPPCGRQTDRQTDKQACGHAGTCHFNLIASEKKKKNS